MKNTIASTNKDPRSVQFQPYHNEPSRHWPVVNLEYTGGLTGLAHFLASNIPNATRQRGMFLVRCYDGRTETDHLPLDKDREAIRVAYATDAFAAMIPDYDFPLIGVGESVNEYWVRVASGMRMQGIEMVKLTPPLGAQHMHFVMEGPVTR